MQKCDCLNERGDDPWLKDRTVKPCPILMRECHAQALRENMIREIKFVLSVKLGRKDQATLCALFPELA